MSKLSYLVNFESVQIGVKIQDISDDRGEIVNDLLEWSYLQLEGESGRKIEYLIIIPPRLRSSCSRYTR